MSSSGEGVLVVAGALFLAGPVSGFAVYRSIQNKYRNRSARYRPESVVAHEVFNLVSEDVFKDRITTQASEVEGRNDASPEQRAKYSNTVKD